MAKKLSAKSILIREAVQSNPDLKNQGIAELLNTTHGKKKDWIEIKAMDVAQQKQAIKKTEAAPSPKAAAKAEATEAVPAKRGKPRAPKKVATAPAPKASLSVSPVELIDSVLSLAHQSGGIEHLKRLVDKLAGLR